ncbi:Protein of unknown function [Gryllus bimaculatus]|nr:Protein of unknown function [Gryllus bimaculatus]
MLLSGVAVLLLAHVVLPDAHRAEALGVGIVELRRLTTTAAAGGGDSGGGGGCWQPFRRCLVGWLAWLRCETAYLRSPIEHREGCKGFLCLHLLGSDVIYEMSVYLLSHTFHVRA